MRRTKFSLAIQPHLVTVNTKGKKRTSRIVNLAVPANHTVKLKECKKRSKYMDLAREFKKLWNMEVKVMACNWRARYSHRKINKEIEGLGNKRKSEDHPNNSIIKISQNTKESSGDLGRLAVIQISVESHYLLLV